MDDAKIKQLTEEVLAQIRGGGDAPESSGLEGRVAALETAVRALQTGLAAPAASTTVVVAQSLSAHPSAILLGPSGAGTGNACILEPDKPCVGSGQCRTLGH